jgi:hypothetical protein
LEICTNVVSGVATCVWTFQLTYVEIRFDIASCCNFVACITSPLTYCSHQWSFTFSLRRIAKHLVACQRDVLALLVPSVLPSQNKLLSSCNMHSWWGEQTRNKLFQHIWYRLRVTSWWQQTRCNLLRTACISLVGSTCSKTVTVINLDLVTRW